MVDEPKTFDMTSVQPFYPGVDESKLANVDLRLTDGRRTETKQTKRAFAELNRRNRAAEQLQKLPGAQDAIHCILKGDFALWDFVPATLALIRRPIDFLTIVTLGFSKNNVDALGQLVDSRQVKRVEILCSHYFSAADSEIYQHMVALCAKHKFRIAAMRTHAKLLLLAIGGQRITIESSANLRSCHNCEQATLFGAPALYDFHREWITTLLDQGSKPCAAESPSPRD